MGIDTRRKPKFHNEIRERIQTSFRGAPQRPCRFENPGAWWCGRLMSESESDGGIRERGDVGGWRCGSRPRVAPPLGNFPGTRC